MDTKSRAIRNARCISPVLQRRANHRVKAKVGRAPRESSLTIPDRRLDRHDTAVADMTRSDVE